uniref:Protein artemis n=1 Tax=Culicoides sonorensis TaxID=179676 RepID=A0A336LHQ8_CULSO
MSTFAGKIKDFPLISIDRFNGDNLKSKAFFLSHCHEDHMIGLRDPEFKGPLYLSPISAVFVRHNFPHITNLIEIINGVPIHIRQTVVTSFPANHCPGSVMFLIENEEKRILYTGDFRLNLNELQRIKTLTQYCDNIDEIYLDSTFFNEDYLNFPTQEESCEAIAHLIREWTIKGQHKKIHLHTSARYGYEWLFIQINKVLNMKILVNKTEFFSYQYIPDMDETIAYDNSLNKLQIHACNKSFKNCTCNAFMETDEVRTIKISAMIWRNWKVTDLCILPDPKLKELYRVCYSNHASLAEIKELLLFFKPKEVFLNVVPQIKYQRDVMEKLLCDIVNGYKEKHSNKGISKTGNEIKLSFSNLIESKKRRLKYDKKSSRNIKIIIRDT